MNAQSAFLYAGIALFSGMLIPIMAALSGSMGRTLGNPQLAAVIIAGGAFTMVLMFAFLTGAVRAPAQGFAGVTPLQLAAGFGMAFYVVAITFLAPRFGVGNSVMLVVAAQIASSAAIDHFGLFGAPVPRLASSGFFRRLERNGSERCPGAGGCAV